MPIEDKFQDNELPERGWQRAQMRRAIEVYDNFDAPDLTVTANNSFMVFGSAAEFGPPDLPEREAWLHGWERNGDELAWADQCAGCGEPVHVYSGDVHDPDWTPPEKTPNFPFNPRTCPLCALRQKMRDECHPKDRLTERLERLAKARKEAK